MELERKAHPGERDDAVVVLEALWRAYRHLKRTLCTREVAQEVERGEKGGVAPIQWTGGGLGSRGEPAPGLLTLRQPETDPIQNVLDRGIAHTLYVVGQTPGDIAIVTPPSTGHLSLRRMGFSSLSEDESSAGFWRYLGDRPST